ncbi:calcium-binding protein [Geminocystis herdmanii]|uniref:calcium-binding protein n=1 Tax=Geminocystis herdmanii TaxID=669359 RepID=UPI00034A9B47|nr:calcium-binding protein [Geminocystis herdmanii]
MALAFSLTPQDDTWNQTVGEAELGAPITEAVEVTALEGNDTVTGTAFNDLILGNQGNDSLDGGVAGDDIIYGGQGDDFVTATTGNNLLLGNLGNDTIIGGSGNDTIYGGQDDDSIVGTAGNNEIFGNLGNDIIIAGSGNDYIHGGQDNDTIVASAGRDTLIGGSGDDTIVLSSADVAGSGDIFDGGDGNDNLLVEANNDLTGATITGIETVSVALGVTLTATLNNLTAVTGLKGQGTIQITAPRAEIETYINSLGANVDASLRILDQDGRPVVGTPDDNPSDPDKERPPVETFTLGADTFAFTGRANAPLDTAAGIFNNVTLQSSDVAIGNGDSDVITVEVGSNTTDTIIPVINPQLTGIETLNFTTTYAGGIRPVFSGSRTTGTETVVFSDSTTGLIVEGMRNTVDVALRNHFAVGGFGDTEINFTTTTSPEINISLENVLSPNTAFIVANHGTFNITSTRVNEIDADVDNQLGSIGGRAGTVNISGDQNLELNATRTGGNFAPSLPTTVSRINAAGIEGNEMVTPFTAALDIDVLNPNGNLTFIGGDGGTTIGTINGTNNTDINFTGGAGNDLIGIITGNTNVNFTGGAGDDRVRFDTQQLNRGDIIDGGEGEDVVSTGFTASIPSSLRMSNVETFEVGIFNPGVTTTIPMNDVTGLNTIVFTNSNDNTNRAQITGIGVVPAVEFKGNGRAGNQQPHTVSMNGTAGADVFNVTYGNDGVALGGNNSYQAGFIRTESVETLNITVEDGSIQFATDLSGFEISGKALKTITFTSENNVTGEIVPRNNQSPLIEPLRIGSDDNELTAIDASAVKGMFKAQSGNLAKGAVVTLGEGNSFFDARNNGPAGNDSRGITIRGQGGNDELLGSRGDDILIGGGGADKLNGGDGKNTFVYNQLTDSLLNSLDSITGGFESGDDLIRVPGTVRRDLPLNSGLANPAIPQIRLDNTSISSTFESLEANAIGAFTVSVAIDQINTYVIFNNGVAGYQSGSDSLFEIVGTPNANPVAPAITIEDFIAA